MKSNVHLRHYNTQKGEKRYYLVVRRYGHSDKTIQLGPISKTEAEKRRVAVLQEVWGGQYRDEPAVHLFFSEFVEKYFYPWLEGSRAPGTVRRYKELLKAVLVRFRGLKQNQIFRYDLESYFAGWKRKTKKGDSRPVSGRTKNILLSLLRLIFSKAVEWQYLLKSPAEGIKRFPEASKGSRALKPSELDSLLADLTTWQRSLVKVMVNSGLRPGEVTNLKFSDIDWNNDLLVVANDEERSTKNHKSRNIPLNAVLRDELVFLKNFLPLQGFAEEGRDHRPRQPHQMEYVFCHEDGSKVDCIRRSIDRALKKHGIRGVTPHGLRKTFCTLLARADVNVKVAQELMGHSDPSLTLSVYTEIDDGMKRDAVDRIVASSKPPKKDLRIVPGGAA